MPAQRAQKSCCFKHFYYSARCCLEPPHYRLPPQQACAFSHPICWHSSELADTAPPLTRAAFGLALVIEVVVTLGATHAAAGHGSCKGAGAGFHSGWLQRALVRRMPAWVRQHTTQHISGFHAVCGWRPVSGCRGAGGVEAGLAAARLGGCAAFAQVQCVPAQCTCSGSPSWQH